MQSITVIAGNYLIPLLKEYVDYCEVDTVKVCDMADSSHSQTITETAVSNVMQNACFLFRGYTGCY